MRNAWLLMALLASACGGEDDPPPPPRQNPNAPAGAGAPAAPAAAPPAAGAPRPAGTKPKIEDRVTIEEEESIRHKFSNRDFVVDENNRDPFQSFVLIQPGLTGQNETLQREVTKKCLRDDQFKATSYSYQDLALVGIIAERTQKRVLMMQPDNKGVLIRKGDCVGREKAVVKDIGAGFITFQVEPEDAVGVGQTRQVEEHSVQLYPNSQVLGEQPLLTPDDSSRPVTPVVTPNGPVPTVPTVPPAAEKAPGAPGSPSTPAAPKTPVVSPK